MLTKTVAEELYRERPYQTDCRKKSTVQERCPNHAKKSVLNKTRIKVLVKKYGTNALPKKCQKTRAKKQQIEMLIETLLDKTAA